ncbi:hypothetical protein [Phaffia rhodozyma]|uniref:Uncharacterized protein n=1 Tax=Phaffia rhodozyma TaxID=264483 RepID=A0A0F7SUE8_PHARH|nr:hypothetical protein [Phaffia rhodozyma]
MSKDIRVASFIRSQVPHLELYKQQGLAHLSHWLETHPIGSSLDTPLPYRDSSKSTASVLGRHEGVRAVNVLAEHVITQARPDPTKASAIKPLARERTRMVDRMKSKNGLERSNSGVGSSKAVSRSIELNSSSRVDRIGEEEVLLTRKELKGRADREKVFQESISKHEASIADQPSAASPSSRLEPTAQVPSEISSPSSKRHRASTSFVFQEPMEELLIMSPIRKGAELDPLSPTPDQPSASRRPRFQSQQQPKLRSEHKSATKTKIKSQAKARAVKSRRTPDTARSDDEDVAVRLNHRREKRRAKAEIIRPRTQRATAVTTSSRALDNYRRKNSSGEKELPGRVEKNRAKEADLGKAAGLSLGLMDHFKAGNLGKKSGGRLTLTRSGPTIGVFNKGMSSAQVSAKGSSKIVGIPDLVFSESRFFARHKAPAPSAAPTMSSFRSSASVSPGEHGVPSLLSSRAKGQRDKEERLLRKHSKSPVAVASNELTDSVKKRRVVYSPSWPSESDRSAGHDEREVKVEEVEEMQVEETAVVAQNLDVSDANPWDLILPPRSATVPPALPNILLPDEKSYFPQRSSSQPCALTKCPSHSGSLIKSHQRVTPQLNDLPSDSTDSLRLLLRAFDRANPARQLAHRTSSQMSPYSRSSIDRAYPRSRSIIRRSPRVSVSNRSPASCAHFLSDTSQPKRLFPASRFSNSAVPSVGSGPSPGHARPVHSARQRDVVEQDRFGWDSTALSFVADNSHDMENEDEDIGPSRSDETRIYTLDEDLAFWGHEDDDEAEQEERGSGNPFDNFVYVDPASAYDSGLFHPSGLHREGGPSSARISHEFRPETTSFTRAPVSSFYPDFRSVDSTRFASGGYRKTAFIEESIDQASVPHQAYGLSIDDGLDRTLATHWKPHRT